jgi:hypothetical protein
MFEPDAQQYPLGPNIPEYLLSARSGHQFYVEKRGRQLRRPQTPMEVELVPYQFVQASPLQ